MKKILIALLAMMVVFGFAACDDDSDNGTPAISQTDLELAKSFYEAAAKDITDASANVSDKTISDVGGYSVTYTYTAGENWSLKVTAEKADSDYTMSFTVGADDTDIVVTINGDEYTVAASSITAGVVIGGSGTDDPEESDDPETDNPEQPDDPEEEGNPGTDIEGTDEMEPVA